MKIFAKGNIVGKPYNGYEGKKLYYEKDQHLTFLFQPTIKYEENIQKKLKNYIKEGDLVFDIGGNIGQYAIPFSELVGNTGRVISFEPDYKNYAFLQFNVNINRCANVSCLNHGVGDTDTTLEFFRDTETGGRMGSFKKEYVRERFKGHSDSVGVRAFDTIIATYGVPDFVKIDVEGFEKEVVSGLATPLPNCTFLIEVREETKEDIFNFFRARDYVCTMIDGPNQIINEAEEIPDFANLIFKKIA